MATMTITIRMDNADFADDPQAAVSRILRNEIDRRVRLFPDPLEWATDSLRDVNGNIVGSIEMADSE